MKHLHHLQNGKVSIMAKKYRVDEIFRSISGETSTAGTPAIFVRLQGCNLKCPYCDTPQEKFATVMCDYEILAKVIEESKGVISHVILTGGEPLCQDVVPLVKLLIKHGFRIQIETNGTKPLPIMHNWVSYAMDIKLPSSEVDDKYKDIMRDNLHNLLPSDEVKFVIANVQDFRVAMNWINDNDIQAKLLFSPMFDEEGKMMYTDFIEDLLNSELKNWRVQIQMHKILNCK